MKGFDSHYTTSTKIKEMSTLHIIYLYIYILWTFIVYSLFFEKTFCPELTEKGLFTPAIRSCHVIYSMRIWYTISHRIVAQIKPKSLNTFCSEALTWRNSTSTNASSPLTNGAPCRRWSRGGVVLRCPRNIFRC